jgi:general secretion pathway protein D
MDVPVLGQLFRTNTLVERRTELVVLLTPRIIRNVEETQSVMDYLSNEFQALLGESEIPEVSGVSENK